MRYGDYLTSPAWSARRAAYFEHHDQTCVACGTADTVQLHHLEYASNLGSEPDTDLLPLCQPHHEGAHAYHQEHSDRLTLRAATARYVALQGGEAPPEGDARPSPRNHDTWQRHVTAPCPTCSATAGEPCVKANGLGHVTKIRGIHKARKSAARRLLR